VKEYVEEEEGSRITNVQKLEGIDNEQDEGKEAKKELDLEEGLEFKEENQAERELGVEEEEIQELEQTIIKEQDVEDVQREEYIKTEDNKEVLEEQEGKEGKIKISTEKTSSNLNNNPGTEESSAQSIKQKLIQNEENVREDAIERLNQEIANLPDFSFEELELPFLPRRQEVKGKTNIQYQARRQFVEKRKQLLTEQPRGPLRSNVRRRQPLAKQSRGSLRSNVDRRSRLPQRRIGWINPRQQKLRS